jgi:CheY-like chemotaxis protein
MSKTIVVVEDDYLQADWIQARLEEAFPQVNILPVSTESEFLRRFDEIASSRPDVVVMDVMLRWADPSPNIADMTDDVKKEGFYRAGLRCALTMAADARTAEVPVILYTVLEGADLKDEFRNLPPNVQYVPKQPELEPLFQKINELTHQRTKPSVRSHELLESV